MQHVVFTSGPCEGKTALRDDKGLVQLDGPKSGAWRHGADANKYHPLCFGWHEVQGNWKEAQ